MCSLIIGLMSVLSVSVLSVNVAAAQDEVVSPDSSSSSGSSSEGSSDGSSAPAAPAIPEPNVTTGPTPMGLFQLVQPSWGPLREELAKLMVPSTVPTKPLLMGPTLRNEATVAFRYGNLKLARELYYGFLARGGKAATEDLQELKFSGHFRRPVWQLRWGVSMGVHGDTAVAGFSPIRVGGGTDAPNGQQVDGFGDSAMSDPGVSDPRMSPDSRSDSSDIREEGMEDGSSDLDSFGQPIDRNAAVAAAPEAQITDESIQMRFEEVMGSVATTLAEGMKTRFERGQFGPAFANVDPESTEQGDTVGGEFVSPSEPRMWIPNVVYLGEESSDETVKIAAKAGLDLLLRFDVAIKEMRNSMPQNLTRVRVVDVRDGKPLVMSGAMDNREVAKAVAANRGSAEKHIADALEKFWPIMDSKLSVIPFPKLTPEVARRRVTGVIGDASYTLLHKLAEIRYLHSQGYLSDEELEQAFAIAGESDAMTILYGSDALAIETIRELAMRQANLAE
jgi:hypothetical protein